MAEMLISEDECLRAGKVEAFVSRPSLIAAPVSDGQLGIGDMVT